MDFCPLSNKPCPHAKNFHITDIINKEVKQLHLCDICASEYIDGRSSPGSPSVDSYLKEIVGLIKFLTQRKDQSLMNCPNCGSSPQDITKTGRFGCAVCYDYYQNSIENIAKRCHEGATHHVGKTPKNLDKHAKLQSNLDIKDQIKRLESKMKKAIKVENYEIAGVLKNKIQQLKSEIQEL